MLNWWIVIPVLAPASHPQSNEDQIVLQRPQLDPVFVANVGEIMKWCHHAQDQSFREMLTSFCLVAKQSLLDFEETDFVQLNAPSLHSLLATGPRENERKSHFFWVARASASCV